MIEQPKCFGQFAHLLAVQRACTDCKSEWWCKDTSSRTAKAVAAAACETPQLQLPAATRQASDGSTASYYELPEGATELQHLISYRNMNAQDGEIFRAVYRKGRASHSDALRDAKKVLFYAQAEVDRLLKYGEGD